MNSHRLDGLKLTDRNICGEDTSKLDVQVCLREVHELMTNYVCLLCNKTFPSKKECIRHVAEDHGISSDDATKYVKAKRGEGKTGEMEDRQRATDIKIDESKLDAEIRAQIESTLKKLLDDYRSLNERVEQLSKRIEGIVGAIGQPQASQTQIPQPQPEVNVLEGEYIPIIRKIAMNPKVLMYYQYARSRGFNGDLADFISEVVEGYFRDRGIKIAVLRGVAEVE